MNLDIGYSCMLVCMMKPRPDLESTPWHDYFGIYNFYLQLIEPEILMRNCIAYLLKLTLHVGLE